MKKTWKRRHTVCRGCRVQFSDRPLCNTLTRRSLSRVLDISYDGCVVRAFPLPFPRDIMFPCNICSWNSTPQPFDYDTSQSTDFFFLLLFSPVLSILIILLHLLILVLLHLVSPTDYAQSYYDFMAVIWIVISFMLLWFVRKNKLSESFDCIFSNLQCFI